MEERKSVHTTFGGGLAIRMDRIIERWRAQIARPTSIDRGIQLCARLDRAMAIACAIESEVAAA